MCEISFTHSMGDNKQWKQPSNVMAALDTHLLLPCGVKVIEVGGVQLHVLLSLYRNWSEKNHM
jgi:hypothetical protein